MFVLQLFWQSISETCEKYFMTKHAKDIYFLYQRTTLVFESALVGQNLFIWPSLIWKDEPLYWRVEVFIVAFAGRLGGFPVFCPSCVLSVAGVTISIFSWLLFLPQNHGDFTHKRALGPTRSKIFIQRKVLASHSTEPPKNHTKHTRLSSNPPRPSQLR